MPEMEREGEREAAGELDEVAEQRGEEEEVVDREEVMEPRAEAETEGGGEDEPVAERHNDTEWVSV